MWSRIAESILKIIEYILSIFVKRSEDKTITDNELQKKILKEEDKIKTLMDKSLKGDQNALKELRKYISD